MERLIINTDWIDIEIIDEPSVVVTFNGYSPVLPVKLLKNGLSYYIHISAKSIANYLEPLRIANNNKFKGLRISIRKKDSDLKSPYEIKLLDKLTT